MLVNMITKTVSCSAWIMKVKYRFLLTYVIKYSCFVSGVQRSSHITSGSIIWKRRKVPRNSSLSCQDCNFMTSSRSLLEIHTRRHTGIKPYVCPDCGKAFQQSSGLSKTYFNVLILLP